MDTERGRYLKFEKWWNGFFHMTREEIVFIVNNLFIGNKLEKGMLALDAEHVLDLKRIQDPIVVFCSDGDNITPPQQALSWIAQVWESTDEIKRRQQVIVYVLHDTIGHLGIFVSGKIARKEHREILHSYDMIEYLPPGIYEMFIEPGSPPEGAGPEYLVRFEERGIEDILLLNEDAAEQEERFPLAAAVSERNLRFYEAAVRPLVQCAVNGLTARWLRQLNPLRMKQVAFSDLNPLTMPCEILAPVVRSHRVTVSRDNPLAEIERAVSRAVAGNLEAANTLRSRMDEAAFKIIFDTASPLNYFYPRARKAKKVPVREIIRKRSASRDLRRTDRQRWTKALKKGGFAEGLIRTVLAVGTADRTLSRCQFNRFYSIAATHPELKGLKFYDFKKIAREQSRILQTDRYRAVRTISDLLKTHEERENVSLICKEVFKEVELTGKTRNMFRFLSIAKDRLGKPVTANA